MSIRMDEIKDPRLRARIEDALVASGGAKKIHPDQVAGVRIETIETLPHSAEQQAVDGTPSKRAGCRIRQSSKPLMNKLEIEWFNIIKDKYPNYPPVRAQAKTFRLCNGVRYTPDFSVSSWPNRNPDDTVRGASVETCFEVKGKKAWDDAIVKIKMAAHEFPEIRWCLVWKQDGQWMTQEVLL